MLLSLDVTLLHLALPELTAALQPSSTQLLWIIDAYAFMIAGFLVTMGTLGDRIGRRRLLLIGAAAFGIASVVAAYAPNAELLIAARALLGVAGATIMPSTLALISTMFADPRQRGMAFGIWAASFSVGIALGPVVGGVLLEVFWWGSAFLLAVPVMVLVLGAAPLLLPEYRGAGAGRLDLISTVLSLAAILPVVYGLKQLAKYGPQPVPVVAVLTGVLLAVVFVRRQLRMDRPLLDLRLFASRSFGIALIVLLFGAAAIGGIYLFVTQYLQLVAGLSPMAAGLRLLPAALLLVLSSTLAPALARRVRPGMVIGGGMAVSAAGYLVLSQPDSSGASTTAVVIGFALVYAGVGPLMALSTALVVGAAPAAKAGAASSIHATVNDLGLAIGIAGLGSIGTFVYRNRLDGALPADVPSHAAAAAHDTLAGAVEASDGLTVELGAQVLAAARGAFADAVVVAAVSSAVVAAALAVLAGTMLRGSSGSREHEQDSRSTG